MAAYTSLDDPDAFFQVVNYSGNGTAIGSGGNAVTLPGETDMQPDIVWIKRRDATADHEIADSGRGVEIRVYPSTDGAQDTGVTEALSVFVAQSKGTGMKSVDSNLTISLGLMV